MLLPLLLFTLLLHASSSSRFLFFSSSYFLSNHTRQLTLSCAYNYKGMSTQGNLFTLRPVQNSTPDTSGTAVPSPSPGSFSLQEVPQSHPAVHPVLPETYVYNATRVRSNPDLLAYMFIAMLVVG